MYSLNILAIIFYYLNVSLGFNVIAFYDPYDELGHVNFVNESLNWFPRHAEQNNYNFSSTDDWNKLSQDNVKNYQLVMFLNGAPYAKTQRQVFQHYMENGGGWMGFHVSAFVDNATEWPWYHNEFLSTGLFYDNTWFPTSATLHNEAPDHPVMKGIPEQFNSSTSEWYSWQKDLRKNPDITVLATIDNSSFPVGTDPDQSWYSGYYPVIWSHKKFKMIYANFGHNLMDDKKNIGTSSTFESNDQNKLVLQALQWLVGK